MSVSVEQPRCYAFAKAFKVAPPELRKNVSRDRRTRATLRRIANLAPSIGEECDLRGLSMRVVRFIAWGSRAQQRERLERAQRWLSASTAERQAWCARWGNMTLEERRKAPHEEPPRF